MKPNPTPLQRTTPLYGRHKVKLFMAVWLTVHWPQCLIVWLCPSDHRWPLKHLQATQLSAGETNRTIQSSSQTARLDPLVMWVCVRVCVMLNLGVLKPLCPKSKKLQHVKQVKQCSKNYTFKLFCSMRPMMQWYWCPFVGIWTSKLKLQKANGRLILTFTWFFMWIKMFLDNDSSL